MPLASDFSSGLKARRTARSEIRKRQRLQHVVELLAAGDRGRKRLRHRARESAGAGGEVLCLQRQAVERARRAEEIGAVSHGCPHSTSASLPGLTRQSIPFEKCLAKNWMDARVKPAHDGWTYPETPASAPRNPRVRSAQASRPRTAMMACASSRGVIFQNASDDRCSTPNPNCIAASQGNGLIMPPALRCLRT